MIWRMSSDPPAQPRLLALSDLHVGYPENRAIVEVLRRLWTHGRETVPWRGVER